MRHPRAVCTVETGGIPTSLRLLRLPSLPPTTAFNAPRQRHRHRLLPHRATAAMPQTFSYYALPRAYDTVRGRELCALPLLPTTQRRAVGSDANNSGPGFWVLPAHAWFTTRTCLPLCLGFCHQPTSRHTRTTAHNLVSLPSGLPFRLRLAVSRIPSTRATPTCPHTPAAYLLPNTAYFSWQNV